MRKYVALINDATGEVEKVLVVLTDGDPVEHVKSTMGYAGTWAQAGEGEGGRQAGRGQVHHEGGFYDRWRQIAGADTGPEGAESGYPAGFRIFHNGKVWISTVDFNVWEPGTSGWREDGAAPDWIQPTGAHDAYALGDRVTHNGAVWVSTFAGANVWAPGAFGWRQE